MTELNASCNELVVERIEKHPATSSSADRQFVCCSLIDSRDAGIV